MSFDGDPACWSWPLPAEAGTYEPESNAGYLALILWQGDRCAICGLAVGGGYLVDDHDHVSALVRGFLCRGCNTREGIHRGPSGTFAKYRERHPASMLGVRFTYWSPVTGEGVL